MNPSTKTNPYKIPISSAVTEGDMEPCQGQPQHNLPITAKKKKKNGLEGAEVSCTWNGNMCMLAQPVWKCLLYTIADSNKKEC